MRENRADSFLRMIRRSQRGKLKIYLGYCAGVGKTWQMLEEGHRLKSEGIDVVAGLVEAHGRRDTEALVDGLEVVPRRRNEYRSIVVEEMDVDAILARKPQVALVDELAHTNVPGSRHAKRYEDVQDLLSVGIHVISTLNLQHVESLYDTVERIAGVKVRERIPDSVIADADEIVNVDLTTADLVKRLEEGKIYSKDRIGTALLNFFKKTNLEQLRELTLREVASQIDLRAREATEPEIPATPDQVMVCLSSRGPNSEKLLRYASRLAGRLNCNWYAVYVQTPSEEPTVIDSHTQRILSGTLTLAKQLGAMVFTYKGEDIAETILHFAREYRVGHIVIGSPRSLSFVGRLLGKQSTVERLIEDARGMSIVVLDTRLYGSPEERTALEIPEAAGSESSTADGPASPLKLSLLLSGQRVLIWNKTVVKPELLGRLAEAAAADAGVDDVAAVVREVIERERKGSTFFNEGVAFPHARIQGLSAPLVTLGLTHQGVTGVSADNPVQCVFLILSPAHSPDIQLRLLAAVSRAAQGSRLLWSLRSAQTPEDALQVIRDWEALDVLSHAYTHR